MKLWYAQPATEWTQALPIGNGRLGAMVYGGIEPEHLQLNEDTLWSGGPHSYDNPDAYQQLATAREQLERGEYADAEATAGKMLGRNKYQQAYMPLGDLFHNFPNGEKPSEYRRDQIAGLHGRTKIELLTEKSAKTWNNKGHLKVHHAKSSK